MITFIFMVITGVLGVTALISAAAARSESAGSRATTAAIGVLAILLSAGIIFFVQMLQTVPAQSIDILLSGGRPSGEIGPGWAWISPWQEVAQMDDSVQTEDYQVADPSSGNCEILIRIANQQTACANIRLRVQLQPGAVDTEFRQYKSTQGVINGLVTPAVQKYANSVFQDYDPIADVNSTVPLGSPGRPTTQQLAAQLEQELQKSIGSDVIIDNLTIPNIQYDDAVQAQLNSAFAQKAKTVIAEQAVQTALEQAQANKDLASSTSLNPLVLVQQCQTYLNTLADKGLVPNAGFSCWPGQGSGIVIPSSSK